MTTSHNPDHLAAIHLLIADLRLELALLHAHTMASLDLITATLENINNEQPAADPTDDRQ